jgi:hypothetical protein
MRTCVFILGLAAILAAPAGAQQSSSSSKVDFTQFVTMGDGLAAGFGDFQLREVYQVNSFPNLIAKQLNVLFPQPLIQSPGIGYVPGFPILPVRLPNTLQTTVRVPAGPKPIRPDGEGQPTQDVFVFNASVPNMTVSDAINRYPSSPLIQKDMQQSTLNIILSYPATLVGPNKPYWTQLQYVHLMNPTFVILSLGYSDVMAAAAVGDPAQVTPSDSFHSSYAAILTGLQSTFAKMVIVNIPDPTDTGFYQTQAMAAQVLNTTPSNLQALYTLKSDDQITLPGLMAIANQLQAGQVGLLPPYSIVSNANVTALKAAVKALNADIASQAQSAKIPVYDVGSLFSQLRANGYLTSSGQLMTANFLGGLYTMSGFYPGATVQALIANGVIGTINTAYGTSIAPIGLDTVTAADPNHRVMLPAVRRTRENK